MKPIGFTRRSGSNDVILVRGWTELEDRYLKLMWGRGVHDSKIADKLHRSVKSIRARANRQGWPRPKRSERLR